MGYTAPTHPRWFINTLRLSPPYISSLTHPTSDMRRIETNRDALPGFVSIINPSSIPVKPGLIFLIWNKINGYPPIHSAAFPRSRPVKA